MIRHSKPRYLRLGWRRILLIVCCAGVAVAGLCLLRGTGSVTNLRLFAAPPPAGETPVKPVTDQIPNHDYSSEPVAVLGDGKQCITREELGEYLIARHGEKVEHLMNRRIMDDACKARGIEVTAAEVEEKLAEDLKDLNADRTRFVKDFLKARHMTLFEWKEDHLRPQLMMLKLYRDQLQVTDDDIRSAYEARYGEKVECRIIEWPSDKKAEAAALYPRLVDSEDAFAEAARKQPNNVLAATGGKVRPFGAHTLEDQEIEKQALALRPGQVSPLIPVPDGGVVVIKCDRRIPANTTVPLDKVRTELAKEVFERRAQKEFPTLFEKLQKEAHAERKIERKPSDEQPPDFVRDAPPGTAKNRVVATLYDGKVTLTRQDLGEYLIQRYGAENLELLVNKRIIENAYKAQGLTLTDTEVEVQFLTDCAKRIKVPSTSHAVTGAGLGYMTDWKLAADCRSIFIHQFLAPNKTSVFEYKEDILRPRMMLARLCQDRVKVTDQDLAAAFEAHYGAKVKCRMILWPPGEEKIVFQDYSRIRESDAEFDKKASTQASPSLAQRGGLLDQPIARHTSGNDELEKAAFSLKPGEISSVIQAPEGFVVLKCVERIPADDRMKIDLCREELLKEVKEKKLEATMPLCFLELRKLAQPRLLIQDPNKGADLTEEVMRQLLRTAGQH